MNLPVSTETARWLAIPMGILFGILISIAAIVFWLIETKTKPVLA
jgi:hypothetical protein